MALPLRRSAPDSQVTRLVATTLPLAVAMLGVAFAGALVFPGDAGIGSVLMALFVIGWGVTMAGRRLLIRQAERAEAGLGEVPTNIDFESGLGNGRALRDLLAREMARCRRYGQRMALVVVEVESVGFKPAWRGQEAPSTARWVARRLTESVRESDVVLRFDQDRYAVLLSECGAEGAESFIARIRTALSSDPVSRNADQSGIYLQAWGAGVPYSREYSNPEAFMRAAIKELEGTRPEFSPVTALSAVR